MKKILYPCVILALLATMAILLSGCTHRCEWGEWVPLAGEEATCTKGGREIRTCLKNAEHTEIRDAGATGHHSSAPATTEAAEICDACGKEISPRVHMLSNKKVIIIGNSHTYFGGVVKEVTQDKMTLADRQNDDGYFYQLCKANGAVNVQVTNWTFGNHSLKDLFSGDCQANRACGNGTDHLQHLTDNNYDYVIFQNGASAGDTIMQWIDFMMNFFKQGNPNTRFLMLVQARAHNDHAEDESKYTWLSMLDDIEQRGVTIVDWGAVAYDLYSGAVELTGEDVLSFNKNSFVIAKSASDGYHPNLLAGYVATLMTYSAITGEKAEGQTCAFCSTTRSFSSFTSKNYKVGTSNYAQIFKSKPTMLALQRLIDTYLAEKAYRNYQ